MRSSVSAKPRPWVTPPITWLSTIIGLTIAAAVVGGDDPQHRHLAGLDVDLDLGGLRAEGADRLVGRVRAARALALDHVRRDLRQHLLDVDLRPGWLALTTTSPSRTSRS